MQDRQVRGGLSTANSSIQTFVVHTEEELTRRTRNTRWGENLTNIRDLRVVLSPRSPCERYYRYMRQNTIAIDMAVIAKHIQA